MNMLKQNKVFDNFVIDGDLFFTIYDYLRFNKYARDHNNIHTLYDLEKFNVDQAKELAKEAINWLKEVQFPNIYQLGFDDSSPDSGTWGTLYYQTLNYMMIVGAEHSIRKGDLNVTIMWADKTIEYLKSLIDEIREPNDEDLNNI